MNGTTFGELKSGDKFIFKSELYQKLSGNLADNLETKKVVEFNWDGEVLLREEW